MDERMLERRRRVRREHRRRRLRRTLMIMAVLALAGGLFALERSPLVELSEVRVSGAERLDPGAVREAAALELGTSTLRLPLGDAERRVENLPLVEEADAHRLNPLVVEIVVRERTPVAVVIGQGPPALVDREGVITSRGRRSGLPVIDIRAHRVPDPGEAVAAVPALATAHRVLRALPGDLREQVTSYRARQPDELVLRLAGGPRVRFGRATAIQEKLRSLRAVREDLGEQTVAVIDVRTPRTPVVEATARS